MSTYLLYEVFNVCFGYVELRFIEREKHQLRDGMGNPRLKDKYTHTHRLKSWNIPTHTQENNFLHICRYP